jgi:hypothetical protein
LTSCNNFSRPKQPGLVGEAAGGTKHCDPSKSCEPPDYCGRSESCRRHGAMDQCEAAAGCVREDLGSCDSAIGVFAIASIRRGAFVRIRPSAIAVSAVASRARRGSRPGDFTLPQNHLALFGDSKPPPFSRGGCIAWQWSRRHFTGSFRPLWLFGHLEAAWVFGARGFPCGGREYNSADGGRGNWEATTWRVAAEELPMHHLASLGHHGDDSWQTAG